MTTAGIYNYHPTIEHPGKFQIQTASQQKPFYFGGSQVPINLQTGHHEQTIKGHGVHKSFHPYNKVGRSKIYKIRI